jgi:ERCC4-type nuclease
VLLCAPSEPPSLRSLGTVSPLCEQNGMDFLWTAHDGTWVGAQRKEVRDLVASIRGDRIARELGQAEGLTHCFLIVEGDWGWNAAGQSSRCRGFQRAQLDGILISIQVEHGWKVLESPSLAGTARLLNRLDSWFAKPSHGSLSRRPKPRSNEVRWGSNGHRATRIHIWQSIDGIGPKVAGALADAFPTMPYAPTCSDADLLAVDGVGPVAVKRIREALG